MTARSASKGRPRGDLARSPLASAAGCQVLRYHHLNRLCHSRTVLVFLVSDADRITGKQRRKLQVMQLMADIAMIGNEDAYAELIPAASAHMEPTACQIDTLDPPFENMEPRSCDRLFLCCVNHDVDPPVRSFAC